MAISVYLSGPMRGVPLFNAPAFDRATAELEDLGYDVFNPVDHDIDLGFDPYDPRNADAVFDLAEALAWDLARVREADCVFVLPGWGRSDGCRAELALAFALGKPVYRYDSADTPSLWPLTREVWEASFAVVHPSLGNVPEGVDGVSVADNILSDREWDGSFDGYHYERREDDSDAFLAQVKEALGKPVYGYYDDELLDDTSEDRDWAAEEYVEESLARLKAKLHSPEQNISVSSTGGRKEVKDARFDLIPVGPLTQVAEHYGKGAYKYDDHQWRKGYEWSKSYAALQRHATQFWGGEDFDVETGSNHMAAVAWHALTLLEFYENNKSFDDRYRATFEEG